VQGAVELSHRRCRQRHQPAENHRALISTGQARARPRAPTFTNGFSRGLTSSAKRGFGTSCGRLRKLSARNSLGERFCTGSH
jgi:hypothetical protein